MKAACGEGKMLLMAPLLTPWTPKPQPAPVGRGHAGGKIPMGMGRDAAGGA